MKMLDAGEFMEPIHILFAGPERIIVDRNGKKWRFEDHRYCGPIVLDKSGDPLDNQPSADSPFWPAIDLWHQQGKRVKPDGFGGAWCVWEKPTMQKMRHVGGNNYVLVTD